MRGSFVAIAIFTCAAAYACDSFDATDDKPAPDAGDDRANVEPDSAGPADASSDQSSGCAAEPKWVTPDAGQAMTTCGSESVSLLNHPKHCGRCDHSCGADSCVGGLCAEHAEDDGAAVIGGVHQGSLFYSRRPGGSNSGKAHELKRLVPGTGAVMMASFGADAGDAGGETEIIHGTAAGDFIYFRTKNAVWRTSATVPSAGVPTFVATLPHADYATIAVDGDRIIVTIPTGGRIDQVLLDGGTIPFIANAPKAGESRWANGKYLWASQAFVTFQGSASAVHVFDGMNDKAILESQDKIGSLAVDGNDLYVMRAAAAGAIVRIDLTTLATEPFYEGPLDNTGYSISVAVDATHVYWVKEVDAERSKTELWKKARCGGEAVRIGVHPNVYGVAVIDERLYFGAEDGLFSIAK